MTAEEANAMLDEMCAKLGEHFDAVQIMVSWNEEGVTACSKRGLGNWYARQGMAHEFIQDDKAQIIGREVGRNMPPPDSIS